MDELKLLNVKHTTLLIPYGVKIPYLLSNFLTFFYTLTNGELSCEDLPADHNICIYAPGLIGIWLNSKPNCKIQRDAKLIMDKVATISKLDKSLIKYRLLYEKFRLGSDVPSPFITHLAHRQGYYNVIKDFTIGDWLPCFTRQTTCDDHIIII